VYVLANIRGHRPVLYIGVTNNLAKRVAEHRLRRTGFTARYNVTTLVYFETTTDIRVAIAREKTLKGWNRQRKLALIQSRNPAWHDLAAAENASDCRTSGDPSLRSATVLCRNRWQGPKALFADHSV
jgi:putative endonuclease